MAKEKINPDANVLTFDDVRVENRKAFKPREEYGGLTIAKINSVVLTEREVPKFNEDGIESNWQYAGYTIPNLEIEMLQRATDKDPHERFFTERFQIVTTITKDGIDVKPDVVKSMYQDLYRRLQHYNNAIKNYPGYKAPVNKGLVVSGTPEQLIASFKAFLQSYVDSFNSVDLSTKWFWFKVVALVSDRGNPYYGTPKIVGDGFIEPYIDKRAPGIELKPAETIVLPAKKDVKAKADDSVGTPAMSSEYEDLLRKYS